MGTLCQWQRTSPISRVGCAVRFGDVPPRSKSLIVTIFGDSLLPSAPELWLSELIDLLEPFHVNAQLARTSAFRLAEEQWLQSRRDGRRSRYSLTASGRGRVEQASHRIYEAPQSAWDGNWTVVMLNKSRSTPAARVTLRRELAWEGFGLLAPGILIHPRAEKQSLADTLKRIGLLRDVVVLEAHDLKGFATRSVTALAEECWDCASVATQYSQFLKRFEPVLSLLDGSRDGQIAFVVQTLLIHQFRRAVLHDPRLPAALLPPNWPGHAAYELCGAIYRRTWRLTRMHLEEHLEAANGRKSQTPPEFLQRFGGLAPGSGLAS